MKNATARTEEQTEGFSNRPINVIKAGNGVQVKTWRNQGKNGEFSNVSIEHSYKDANDEWQTQKVSIPADALLSTALALQDSHREIMKNRGQGQER